MITLTQKQGQAIPKAGEEPVRLADPETQTEYAMLMADVYDRLWATGACLSLPSDQINDRNLTVLAAV
jgi:hypothetical protein